MAEVVVEHEYVAAEKDELTIKPGDVITNVIKLDGGWWEGDLNGKHGVFPDNFVKEVEKKKVSKKEGSVKKPGGGGHVAELANRLKDGGIKMGPPVPGAVHHPSIKRPGQDANKRKVRAKASFSYNPENDDELRLEVGNVIEILKQEEEGWWEGNLNGKVGMFPSNFVEVIEDEEPSPAPVDSPAQSPDNEDAPTGEFVQIGGKKVKGVGLGNIFAAGPIKLRGKEVNRESNDSPQPEDGKPDSNRNSLKKAPPPVPKDSPAKEPPAVPAKDHRHYPEHDADEDDDVFDGTYELEIMPEAWVNHELESIPEEDPKDLRELEDQLSRPIPAPRTTKAKPTPAPRPRTEMKATPIKGNEKISLWKAIKARMEEYEIFQKQSTPKDQRTSSPLDKTPVYPCILDRTPVKKPSPAAMLYKSPGRCNISPSVFHGNTDLPPCDTTDKPLTPGRVNFAPSVFHGNCEPAAVKPSTPGRVNLAPSVFHGDCEPAILPEPTDTGAGDGTFTVDEGQEEEFYERDGSFFSVMSEQMFTPGSTRASQRMSERFSQRFSSRISEVYSTMSYATAPAFTPEPLLDDDDDDDDEDDLGTSQTSSQTSSRRLDDYCFDLHASPAVIDLTATMNESMTPTKMSPLKSAHRHLRSAGRVRSSPSMFFGSLDSPQKSFSHDDKSPSMFYAEHIDAEIFSNCAYAESQPESRFNINELRRQELEENAERSPSMFGWGNAIRKKQKQRTQRRLSEPIKNMPVLGRSPSMFHPMTSKTTYENLPQECGDVCRSPSMLYPSIHAAENPFEDDAFDNSLSSDVDPLDNVSTMVNRRTSYPLDLSSRSGTTYGSPASSSRSYQSGPRGYRARISPCTSTPGSMKQKQDRSSVGSYATSSNGSFTARESSASQRSDRSSSFTSLGSSFNSVGSPVSPRQKANNSLLRQVLSPRSNIVSPRSETSADGDVPLEVGNLSHTRATPPPRDSFIRKRRSRGGTPKESPAAPMFATSTPSSLPGKPPVKKFKPTIPLRDDSIFNTSNKENRTPVSDANADVFADNLRKATDAELMNMSLEMTAKQIVMNALKGATRAMTPDNSVLLSGCSDENVSQIASVKSSIFRFESQRKSRSLAGRKTVSFIGNDRVINMTRSLSAENIPNARRPSYSDRHELDIRHLNDSIQMVKQRSHSSPPQPQQKKQKPVKTHHKHTQTIVSVPIDATRANPTSATGKLSHFLNNLTRRQSKRYKKRETEKFLAMSKGQEHDETMSNDDRSSADQQEAKKIARNLKSVSKEFEKEQKKHRLARRFEKEMKKKRKIFDERRSKSADNTMVTSRSADNSMVTSSKSANNTMMTSSKSADNSLVQPEPVVIADPDAKYESTEAGKRRARSLSPFSRRPKKNSAFPLPQHDNEGFELREEDEADCGFTRPVRGAPFHMKDQDEKQLQEACDSPHASKALKMLLSPKSLATLKNRLSFREKKRSRSADETGSREATEASPSSPERSPMKSPKSDKSSPLKRLSLNRSGSNASGSYFQTLQKNGRMSARVSNIFERYKLTPTKPECTVLPDDTELDKEASFITAGDSVPASPDTNANPHSNDNTMMTEADETDNEAVDVNSKPSEDIILEKKLSDVDPICHVNIDPTLEKKLRERDPICHTNINPTLVKPESVSPEKTVNAAIEEVMHLEGSPSKRSTRDRKSTADAPGMGGDFSPVKKAEKPKSPIKELIQLHCEMNTDLVAQPVLVDYMEVLGTTKIAAPETDETDKSSHKKRFMHTKYKTKVKPNDEADEIVEGAQAVKAEAAPKKKSGSLVRRGSKKIMKNVSKLKKRFSTSVNPVLHEENPATVSKSTTALSNASDTTLNAEEMESVSLVTTRSEQMIHTSGARPKEKAVDDSKISNRSSLLNQPDLSISWPELDWWQKQTLKRMDEVEESTNLDVSVSVTSTRGDTSMSNITELDSEVGGSVEAFFGGGDDTVHEISPEDWHNIHLMYEGSRQSLNNDDTDSEITEIDEDDSNSEAPDYLNNSFDRDLLVSEVDMSTNALENWSLVHNVLCTEDEAEAESTTSGLSDNTLASVHTLSIGEVDKVGADNPAVCHVNVPGMIEETESLSDFMISMKKTHTSTLSRSTTTTVTRTVTSKSKFITNQVTSPQNENNSAAPEAEIPTNDHDVPAALLETHFPYEAELPSESVNLSGISAIGGSTVHHYYSLTQADISPSTPSSLQNLSPATPSSLNRLRDVSLSHEVAENSENQPDDDGDMSHLLAQNTSPDAASTSRPFEPDCFTHSFDLSYYEEKDSFS